MTARRPIKVTVYLEGGRREEIHVSHAVAKRINALAADIFTPKRMKLVKIPHAHGVFILQMPVVGFNVGLAEDDDETEEDITTLVAS